MTSGAASAGVGSVADPFELQGVFAAFVARDSAPAAGSAAAIVAALGAAVVAKAAWRGGDQGSAAQALALAGRLTKLASLDADVFAVALGALKQATERGEAGEAGSDSRDFQLGRTLQQAAAVPLAIAEAAADVAFLAAEVVRSTQSELREDAASAAILAEGAARAAAHLVSINLAAGPDDDAAARAAVDVAVAAAGTVGS